MRHWRGYVASLVTILLGITVIYKPNMILEPIDNYTGNSVWDQRSNYLGHGATLYSLQETTRFFALADVPPDMDSAQAAAENLLSMIPKPTVTDKPFTPRNIHIVLLESFWDANGLKKAHYNQNPLSPEFRKLWKSAGYSHALSPVFGGYMPTQNLKCYVVFPWLKTMSNLSGN
ncbi:MAG: phosphoglycerol transferase family protein, alkaline phosphatase superfamily [Methylococcaceae bacterium NSP1-2]|nr:MAG: phosphoglycerol transferase family protein, alkaline phosphatase superfamily [Methylococcaceae bacterium NSP1-2]